MLRIQRSLSDVIPTGFTALRSTEDGDCLFTSASLALLGNESASSLLHFISLCSAVDHFSDYLKLVGEQPKVHYCIIIQFCNYMQYVAELKEPDSAQQFVCTMASCDLTFLNRPQDNPTTECLIKYILMEEICTTAHCGAYSGMLYLY